MLAAIGTRPGQIIQIFTWQAIMVGVLGTLLGLIGGLLVLWLRDDLRALLASLTGGQVHAVEGVFLSTIPARLDAWHISATCVFSVLLCITAGFIPAWIAARLEPAEALRD
jgi:lipoprotein-releasing system permease protein